MKIESDVRIMDFDPFNTRTEPESTHAAGDSIVLADQRKFRHATVGAVAISPGKLQLAPAQKANHHNAIAIASVLGTTTPTFTLGATAAVANEYNEGYVGVNVTPDVGRVYKVSSMGAVASSGTANPTLFEGIVAAWTTSTRVSLVHNAYNGIVEAAVATRRAAGIPLIALAIGDFGWVQTKGLASALAGSAVTAGGRLISDSTTAGAVTDNTDVTTVQTEVQVGWGSVMAGVTGEYRPIVLTID